MKGYRDRFSVCFEGFWGTKKRRYWAKSQIGRDIGSRRNRQVKEMTLVLV
jgi:hypothetical protein